ncbi:Pyruvate kinase [Cupriavidus laharis]|uniref:Pyruvate kinase n=1 Tax=Cupriavidus laharis TaxID=151654 RepID=A0ABM8XUQ5_9BURK|nr:Pyruvate kinase [Cupriavidus laharis]
MLLSLVPTPSTASHPIQQLEAIVVEADAVMVARGDLGVEMPAEMVPSLQKQIIRACCRAGKPVIVAT